MSIDSGSGGGDGESSSDETPLVGDTTWEIPSILTGGSLRILKSFVANPRRFILGAILTSILEGLFSIVTEALYILQLGLVGSSPTKSFPEEDVWGLADIAASLYRLLGQAGLEIGSEVIESVQALNNPLYELAGSAGPAAPLVVAIFLSAELVAVLLILEYTVRALADIVPGLGGLV